MRPRTTAMVGVVAILVAAALVPPFWHCSGEIRGWNFVIFALVAVGGSMVGSAAGRRFRSRYAGILATVTAVLAALLAVGALGSRFC